MKPFICFPIIVVAMTVFAAVSSEAQPGPGPGPVPNVWTQNGTTIYSNNSGNVGIGSASPTDKLGVVGCIGVYATSGKISLCPQPDSESYDFNLPIALGEAGEALLSGGSGSAMIFGTVTNTVDDVNALEQLGQMVSAYSTVKVLGYYTPGDGGGFTATWDPSSVATPGMCGPFEVTGVVTGRYIVQPMTPWPVRACGVKADGVYNTPGSGTDDTAAWTAAFALHTSLIGPSDKNQANPLISRVTAQLILDEFTTSLNCDGMQFDMSGISSPTTAAILIENSINSAGKQSASGNVRPLENCSFYGPDKSSGVYLFHFVPTDEGGSGTPYIVNVNTYNLSAMGFAGMFWSSNGSVFLTNYNPHYSITYDFLNSAGAYWTIDATTNAGEGLRTFGGDIHSTDVIVDKGCHKDTTFSFYGTSLDGNTRILTGDNGSGPGSVGACVKMDFSGWIEALSGTDYAWYLQDGGEFNFISGDLVLYDTSPFSSKSPCEVDSSQGQGGVFFHAGVMVQGVDTTSVPGEFFCSGDGVFQPEGIQSRTLEGQGALSSINANLLPDFNFTGNPFSGIWTSSGGGITYDTTTAPTGATGSIKEVGPTLQRAVVPFSCSPGQSFGLQGWYKTSDFSGAQLEVDIHYLDRSGNDLGGSFPAFINTTGASTFQIFKTGFNGGPPGTASCTADLINENGTGSPTVWWGRLWIGNQ